MQMINFDDMYYRHGVLMEHAVAATNHAYAPYSNFCVGAAALLKNGEVITGSNLENVSYGLTVCAEVAMLAAINSAGKTDMVEMIAIAARNKTDHQTNPKNIVTPCGRCRQMLLETVKVIGHDIRVFCLSEDGTRVMLTSVNELLPFSFNEF